MPLSLFGCAQSLEMLTRAARPPLQARPGLPRARARPDPKPPRGVYRRFRRAHRRVRRLARRAAVLRRRARSQRGEFALRLLLGLGQRAPPFGRPGPGARAAAAPCASSRRLDRERLAQLGLGHLERLRRRCLRRRRLLAARGRLCVLLGQSGALRCQAQRSRNGRLRAQSGHRPGRARAARPDRAAWSGRLPGGQPRRRSHGGARRAGRDRRPARHRAGAAGRALPPPARAPRARRSAAPSAARCPCDRRAAAAPPQPARAPPSASDTPAAAASTSRCAALSSR